MIKTLKLDSSGNLVELDFGNGDHYFFQRDYEQNTCLKLQGVEFQRLDKFDRVIEYKNFSTQTERFFILDDPSDLHIVIMETPTRKEESRYNKEGDLVYNRTTWKTKPSKLEEKYGPIKNK